MFNISTTDVLSDIYFKATNITICLLSHCMAGCYNCKAHAAEDTIEHH